MERLFECIGSEGLTLLKLALEAEYWGLRPTSGRVVMYAYKHHIYGLLLLPVQSILSFLSRTICDKGIDVFSTNDCRLTLKHQLFADPRQNYQFLRLS